jgi:hypothetical protein
VTGHAEFERQVLGNLNDELRIKYRGEPHGTVSIPVGPIETEPMGVASHEQQAAVLKRALAAAGVDDLGAYERRTANWLGGWEWSTIAIIASWLERAHEAGARSSEAKEG